jgi:hypothetical protein
MQTTVELLRNWLEEGKTRENVSHLIVVCDLWDYEEYPMLVYKHENVVSVINSIDNINMQKIMEVYSYDKDIENQLTHPRSWNI